MSTRVETNKEFLQALHLLKPKFQKVLLKACSREEINCLCECVYNVLKGKVPLKENQKKLLNNHKSLLRNIVLKGNTNYRKKILVQKGGAFLPIILGSILSTILGSLIK